jgi:hypothetical protein
MENQMKKRRAGSTYVGIVADYMERLETEHYYYMNRTTELQARLDIMSEASHRLAEALRGVYVYCDSPEAIKTAEKALQHYSGALVSGEVLAMSQV